MIIIKQVDKSFLPIYDKIPIIIEGSSIFKIEKINNGLGGMILKEVEVEPFKKDLSVFENPSDWPNEFNIDNWVFFMAFDDDKPVGAVTALCKTPSVRMLDNRDDLAVLWDIRVDNLYKHQGIGKMLLDEVRKWAKAKNIKQIKIETQNNNVNANRFYEHQGGILGQINEYAYYNDENVKDEVMLIWYINL